MKNTNRMLNNAQMLFVSLLLQFNSKFFIRFQDIAFKAFLTRKELISKLPQFFEQSY